MIISTPIYGPYLAGQQGAFHKKKNKRNKITEGKAPSSFNAQCKHFRLLQRLASTASEKSQSTKRVVVPHELYRCSQQAQNLMQDSHRRISQLTYSGQPATQHKASNGHSARLCTCTLRKGSPAVTHTKWHNSSLKYLERQVLIG